MSFGYGVTLSHCVLELESNRERHLLLVKFAYNNNSYEMNVKIALYECGMVAITELRCIELNFYKKNFGVDVIGKTEGK